MFVLWILFYLMCALFVGMILLQQGKGDIGFGIGASKLTQNVFGGSGGLEFFEKATWAMGAAFFISCLCICYMQTKDSMASVMDMYKDTVYLNQDTK